MRHNNRKCLTRLEIALSGVVAFESCGGSLVFGVLEASELNTKRPTAFILATSPLA